MAAVEHTDQATLSREDMDRVAKQHGCTINISAVQPRKHGARYVYLRSQGVPLYLGYLSAIEQLSEADFAAKITKKLEEQYV